MQADSQDGFIGKNQDFFRSLPVVSGGVGFVSLLANRFLSDVAPFVDASSSQSRVDVLVIGMAATLALTGFQWLVLKPVEPKQVNMIGKDVTFTQPGLKSAVKTEVAWAWDSIKSSTCCQSMTVVYAGTCVYQAGLIPEESKPGRAVNGSICRGVMKSGKANFLANLVLYPGRVEFDDILPGNTSCAIIAPIGKKGVLIAGGDTQRGFGRIDQAWISTIADKLDDTFENFGPGGSGFKGSQ
eukprot:jgi/Ulvmu1/6705/UM030_0037.1